MAKTTEELNALKDKVRNLKKELGTLSEEELNQISGGDETTDCTGTKTCPRCGSTNVFHSETGCHCFNCGKEWL